MKGLRDFLSKDHGFVVILLVLSLALIVSATIFVIVGRATFAEWQALVLWIFGLFASGGIAHQGVISIGGRTPSAPGDTPNPTAPAA